MIRIVYQNNKPSFICRNVYSFNFWFDCPMNLETFKRLEKEEINFTLELK